MEDDREEALRLLYGVFRIPDEDYIVTVKLLCIYDWVAPEAGDEVYKRLAKMRSELKRMSNQRKIDMLYRMAEHQALLRNNRSAPKEARPPTKRQDYISGWLPY